MTRGFACVSLVNPKTPENVGGALRAAGCYGAAQIAISGVRGGKTFNNFLRHGTNVQQTQRHTPVFIVDDPLAYRPHDTQVVVVELIDGAAPLPIFEHPARALYVFGPEDGTLGKAVTDRAQHVVQIPTRSCMNLAATVNVLLYDRLAKGAPFNTAYPRPDFTHITQRHRARQERVA